MKTETTLLVRGPHQDPGPVPLVIGVVGHREPMAELVPLLRRNLRLQLQQLLRELPHMPLLMLNGRAEGCDSLAAEVFLEVVAHDREQRGAKAPPHLLVAVLPMTPKGYRADFQGPLALARLDDLLRSGDGVLHPGNCDDLCMTPSPDGQPRKHDDPTCYGQQGNVLVRNSSLLFAFCETVDSPLLAGTTQILAMLKGELHPLVVSVDEDRLKQEACILVRHRTPRRKPGLPQVGTGSITYWPLPPTQNTLPEDISIPEHLLKLPKHLEQMNLEMCAVGLA